MNGEIENEDKQGECEFMTDEIYLYHENCPDHERIRNELDKIRKGLDEISINLSQKYQDIVGEIWNSKIGLIHVPEFCNSYRAEIMNMRRSIDFKLDELHTQNENMEDDALDILDKKIDRLRED